MLLLLNNSCQKDFSYEGGQPPRVAVGAVNCSSFKINGLFVAGEPLTVSNSIELNITVTEAGTYSIKTQTLNGYYFSAEGSFANAGQYKLTLQAKGTPEKAGSNQFTISLNQSTCQVEILVEEKNNNAIFDIKTPAGDCIGFSIGGRYIQQTVLDLTNTIDIRIDVKQAGPYQISTITQNGFQFKSEGYLSNTGQQWIKFFANGIPLQTGITSFEFIVRTDTCRIEIFVEPKSLNDYFPRTANSYWAYEIDDKIDDTARFFASASTQAINGKSFNVFMVSRGVTTDTSGYYRRAGSQYWRYADIGDFIGFDQPQWQEYVFLDDALPVGSVFLSNAFNGTVTIAPLPPQPMTVRFTNKIILKDGIMDIATSSGLTRYVNVIGVEEKYERLIAGTWVDITSQVGSFIKYYAKDVGMIRYDAINAAGNLAAQFELKEYKVY